MVPKLIGTKELENQQYIGQTPHKYVHIDMKLNFMLISSNLRLGGVSPIYWVKERKHAKWNTWSKHACSRLSKPETKNKEMPSEKDTKWRNHHLEDIIKRYIKEWDIHWNPQNDIKLSKERMVPNKPSSLQSFMMAQVPKRNGLPSTNTHLIRITRRVF